MKIKSLYSKLFQKISKKAKAEPTTEKEKPAPINPDEDFEIHNYGEGLNLGKKALLTSPERVKAFVGGISKGITFNSNPKLVYTELTADGQPDHPAWLFDINGKSGTYQMYIDIFPKRDGACAYNCVGFSSGHFKQIPVEDNLKIKDMSSMKRTRITPEPSLEQDTFSEETFDGEVKVYTTKGGRLECIGSSLAEYHEYVSSIGDVTLFKTGPEHFIAKKTALPENKSTSVKPEILLNNIKTNIR